LNQYIRFSQLFFIGISYFSWTKIVNLGKLLVSYLLSMVGFNIIGSRKPFFISIEAANFCNLHCPECPVGLDIAPRPTAATFDQMRYQNLVNELRPTLFHIIFYFQGEPFLNRELSNMIDYAHNAHIYTSTSTNGHFLNNKSAREIVLSGLDKLIVSIDGCTQEVYEKYRKGGNLQRVLGGIEAIMQYKKELHSVTPLVEIQFIVFKTNEHQIEDMKRLAKMLKVERLSFKTAQLYDFENGNELMTTIDKYARYKKTDTGKYEIKSTLPNHCKRLWGGAVINTQGEILPCCFDKGSDYSFGSIKEQSFASNWHSAKATDFRSKILQNRKQFEMCRNCTSK